MNQRNLLEVDWSKIPAPQDDGAAAHLVGMTIPPISLIATDDTSVTLSALRGRTVVFAYPRTGEPGKIARRRLGHDSRCARLHTADLRIPRSVRGTRGAGAKHVFGLSTQDNVYQTEMASRLHLPFPVLSDEKLALTRALNLPTMEVAGLTLIKRLALMIDDGPDHPRLLSGVSARPERRRCAGLAEAKSGCGNSYGWASEACPPIRDFEARRRICPRLRIQIRSAPSRTRCETSPASAPACCVL